MAMTVESFVKKAAKSAADELELETREDGTHVLRFRYGRESEPFVLRGESDKDKLRDLGVHVERFMGAR